MTLQTLQKKGKEPVDPNSSQGPFANEKTNQQIVGKKRVENKDSSIKEVDKVSTFSLENEIAKLKVLILLTELTNNNIYKNQVSKNLNIDSLLDMVNVEDDHLELIFGPALEVQSKESEVHPFYISLRLSMSFITPCLISEPLLI